MKKYLLLALLMSTAVSGADTMHYHCEGITTSSMGSVAKREEADSKSYAFSNGQTEIFNERVQCNFSESVIRCRSEKFNRTLEIERSSGKVTDLYEIFKNGQPHVRIEFSGNCRPQD